MKEKSIKKAFENWASEQGYPSLPKGHEQRFLKRLKRQKSSYSRRVVWQWAAVALFCFGLSQTYRFISVKPSEEVLRFQQAETHFTTLINQQLEQLATYDHPKAPRFLESSQKQIKRIQNNYKTLYLKWEAEPNQPQLIQALITNLKTQINLLENLQDQLINIKKNEDENKIL
ncbi:MAG: hypothetical protein ACI9TK_001479 [Flavobacteriaceae bacterium]|jgi:hypothetical protein